MHVIVTGSSGLIGSEAVRFFDAMGFDVTGVDNNLREDFFGPMGSTTWNRKLLIHDCSRFRHLDRDIRDREGMARLFRERPPDIVVHAAAQPSHDLAARRPFDDFEVNALGTLNLLEAARESAPECVFVFLSTNKVYGDGPNRIPLRETDSRWEFDDPRFEHGIDESFPVDGCLHSLFGVSKLSADLLVQEYGRYFGLRTGVFRGGCLTGPAHSGVELHGFLSHLTDCAVLESSYTVFGYKGKQVRDQIHSRDVVGALWEFAQDPRPGEVYNIGGGRENAASLLELVDLIEQEVGSRPRLVYSNENRIGDHICYYSDLRKFREQYPRWTMEHDLRRIISEIAERCTRRMAARA